MNDGAAAGLGVLAGAGFAMPSGGLSAGLRAMVVDGIELREQVVVWNGGALWAAPPPGNFGDLTGWECFVNSFHLEDLVPVDVALSEEGEPSIGEVDQVVLLRHGVAFALEICRLVADMEDPIPVRCIVSTNRTNGTFRFHKIRDGQSGVYENLDVYREEKVAVVDFQPAG
ncbi:hypothetical protein Rhe02_35670 [Rhizocola hellebori]|uniref:Uncharacterized protein n=2 Tax=Rhizocola hellebori TaxID=1392758 RepID=A0A8J3VGJ6_9ACTN|nr:hypothetical protein Rhe02_35670 [Rhizocola hellebori]